MGVDLKVYAIFILGCYVGHCVCVFVVWVELCWPVRLSVFCVSYVGHWVCLFVGWGNYV